MARILIGTVPIAGHVTPMLPLARALVARGHEVRWHSGRKYRDRIEATGARFIAPIHARDYDDAALDDDPARAALRGIEQLKYDMKHVFIDNAVGQLADLREITREFPADLVLVDPTMLGAIFHADQSGAKVVVLGVVPMAQSSVDTAPFGLGLPPSQSPLGRTRNRALHWLVQHVLFRDVQRHWNETRARAGLPATGWWIDTAAKATLYLQPTVPGFEYPRSDLAPNVRFIGMLPAEAPSAWAPPPFWPELERARTIVHVTQGTVANSEPLLIAPTLEALAHEDVLVVVATGGRPVESLGLRNVPANARIGTFLSYPELLPKTQAMVTNGGYGGVQIALSHGVPLVVAGASEDKPEVAARVAWSGAGINLKTATPSPAAVRRAVRALLHDPKYRARAAALAAEYARHDAVARAVELIEEVATGSPESTRARVSYATSRAALPHQVLAHLLVQDVDRL